MIKLLIILSFLSLTGCSSFQQVIDEDPQPEIVGSGINDSHIKEAKKLIEKELI